MMIPVEKIMAAIEIKPKMGEPCNNCGWCCLTEVCVVGQEITGNSTAPCSLLIEEDGKHICKLAAAGMALDDLAIGTGCDAMTQQEIIDKINLTA